MVLRRDEFLQIILFGGPLRLANFPFEEIGEPEVTNLAGADQIVQGAHGFLDRRQPVRPVHLIEVDVVGLEPPQARLAGPHDMQARGSDIVRAVVHPVENLVAMTALSRRPTSAAPSFSSDTPMP